MRKTYHYLIYLSSLAASFFLAEQTFAGQPKIGHPPTLPGPADEVVNYRSYFIDVFVPYFVKSFSYSVGGLSLVLVIIGGIQYLVAYGEQEKLDKAKNTIIYALLGLGIVLLSYAIVSIITSLDLPTAIKPAESK